MKMLPLFLGSSELFLEGGTAFVTAWTLDGFASFGCFGGNI